MKRSFSHPQHVTDSMTMLGPPQQSQTADTGQQAACNCVSAQGPHRLVVAAAVGVGSPCFTKRPSTTLSSMSQT